MYLADTLSRVYQPSSKNTQGDFDMVNVLKILPVSEEKHDEILGHTSKDEVLQLLKEVILTGWPANKKSLPAVLNPYYRYLDELPVYNGLILGENVLLFHTLCYQTMKQLHSSHLGINGCLRRARECLFWLSMSAKIKEYIIQCEICSQYYTILAARNTPTEYIDSSPVQRLLGRCTKTQQPITTGLLKPQHVNTEDINKRIKTRQQKQVHYYNRKARDLPPLHEGDVVRMRPFTLNGKTWDKATVAKSLFRSRGTSYSNISDTRMIRMSKSSEGITAKYHIR